MLDGRSAFAKLALMGDGRSESLDGRALEIVELCVDLAPAELEALMARRCAGDDALAARVREILARSDDALDLLSTRVLEIVHPELDPPPERIGKFQVTGLIGRGGMGTVVRAVRDDGLYDQQVAIKLVQTGLLSEAARERFETERRLLARLSHPAIARILDGGEQDGRPYLVMELVEGRSLVEDLRARSAGLDETLDVFAEVAEAVSHAHRNLVIHGDIKSSNILRSADGSVKLLDFGIGRMADLDPGAAAFPLTPAYASPERRGGEAPTVASDVYSLAVLLGQMLTDDLPGGGSRARLASPRIPQRLLTGDLEAILARGQAPDPAQRYPDVAAFLADIDAFRHARPVAARPPRAAHAFALFVKRNRWGVMIGAAFAVILTLATAVSLSLYLDARRQRGAAEARFAELRSLASYQLFELYDRLAEIPGTTRTRAGLAAEAQHYLDRLASLPDAPADVRLDVARGFDRLASVQGVPRVPNLGRLADARANLERGARLLAILRAERPGDPEVSLESARNHVLRAQVATWFDFRTDRAQRLLAEAQPMVSAAEGLGERQREVDLMRRSASLDLLGWAEQHGVAKGAADELLDWLGRWPRSARTTRHLLGMTDVLASRGDALYYLGNRRAALADYRRADSMLARAERLEPRNAAVLARLMLSGYNVITTLAGLGQTAELPPLAVALVARGERTLALEANDDTLRRRHFVNRELAAQILADAGRYPESIAQQRQLVAERVALLRVNASEPQPIRDLAFSRSVLGRMYWQSGDNIAACGEWSRADALLAPLDRSGRLNAYDRARNLAYIRHNLEICSGRLPRTAYRPPE